MSMMLGTPNHTYVTSAGVVYVADQNGIITNVGTASDVSSLQAAGCSIVNPSSMELLAWLKGANMNSTADQAMVMFVLPAQKYRVRRVTATNASGSLSTAAGGIYTALSKGGTAIVASTQTYSALTSSLLAEDLTVAVPNNVQPAGTPLYLSLTTPQGSTYTADIYVYGDIYN
jgi:membrane-bound inhibitor of C-type lysozyme